MPVQLQTATGEAASLHLDYLHPTLASLSLVLASTHIQHHHFRHHGDIHQKFSFKNIETCFACLHHHLCSQCWIVYISYPAVYN